MAYGMKKRRRTLKNRKYAQNCRSKRLEQKSEMEIQNYHLKHEIQRLNHYIEKLKHENSVLKAHISNKNETTSPKVNESNNGLNGVVNNTSCGGGGSGLLPMTPTKPPNSASMTQMSSRNNGISINFNGNESQLTHLLSMPLLKSSENSNEGSMLMNSSNKTCS